MKLDWHREYVGGLWDEIGRLQFEFLRARGLKPAHRLFDVACGSLRAGVHFIPYLNADRYFGLDRNSDLIQAGTERELNPRDFHDKRPNFVVSGAFEFEKFGVTADIALAQSLFTHLTPDAIATCLRKLRDSISQTGVFYATFNECAIEQKNPAQSHDHQVFRYTLTQMYRLAHETGWYCKYIGDWGHPRGQKMLELRPKATTGQPVSISLNEIGDRPNLLLFGVGHSRTSITAKMLNTLGWSLGDADGFSEHVGIRRLNSLILAGKRPSDHDMSAAFCGLTNPWVVKDPRFVLTLRHWIPVFEALPASQRPTLLYLTRDIAKVERTYSAYGEVIDGVPGMYRHTVQELSELALQAYDVWPFAKLRLRFEQIVAAAKTFNVGRAERRDGNGH